MSRIYSQRIISDGVKTRYYITVPNSAGEEVEVEVEENVYEAIEDLQREAWRMDFSDYCHLSRMDMMFERELPASLVEKSAEEALYETLHSEDIKNKLQQLGTKQLRRFLLHDLLGYSIEQIALLEGCSKRAIDYSLQCARKNLRKIFGEDFA